MGRGLIALALAGVALPIWILPTQASSGTFREPSRVVATVSSNPGSDSPRISSRAKQSGQTFLKRVGQAGSTPCNADPGADHRVPGQQDWLRCRALLIPPGTPAAPPGVKVRVLQPGQALHWHRSEP